MAIAINQKTVILNERLLFKEKQVVDLIGSFPIQIKTNSVAAPSIRLVSAGGTFELLIDGMNTSNFDQISSGSGSLNGVAFEYIIHTIFVGVLGTDKVYEVSITVYAA